MKKNNVLSLFSVALLAMSIASNPASAAPATQGYTDSTFTLSLNQGDHINVSTSNINLTIRRWADSKAKLVVTAAPADWESDLRVIMRPGSGGIVVELSPKPNYNGGSIRLSPSWSSIKATLDIPDGHEFELSSSFANVDLLSDFKKGKITLNNGELTASAIPELELNAQFSKVHLTSCVRAKITLNNGELTASAIPQLDLKAQFAKVHLTSCQQAEVTANNTTMTIGTVENMQLGSQFSHIELTTVNRLTLTSNNDELSIAELGEAAGRKTFGSFKIGKLKKGFSLLGQNADVSFREIASTVDTLKIKDQFANLHLPVDGLPAFSLSFEGDFAHVRTSLPRKVDDDRNEMNHYEFTISKGIGSGKFPTFSLHCNNCEVDLE